MKLILPVEHRIQQKGEKYGDAELIRDAIEVSNLRRDLGAHRKANNGLAIALAISDLVVFAIAIYWWAR
jgi:hypothetical protein